MSNNYKVEVTFLSPVHVGTGVEIEPFDYVVKKDNDIINLYLIDLLNWLSKSERGKKLAASMNFNSAGEVRKNINNQFNTIEDGAFIKSSIQVADKTFYEKYEKAIASGSLENQLIVNLLNRSNVNYIPYLPGSSIKGAIRTSFLEKYRSNKKLEIPDRCSYRDVQKIYTDFTESVIGTIKLTPFKLLKIGDVRLITVTTCIMEAKELKNSPSQNSTPKGYFEMTDGLTLTQQEDDLENYKEKLPFYINENPKIITAPKNIKLDVQNIIETTRSFYLPKLKLELETFYYSDNFKQISKLLLKQIEVLKANETIIRVGRFSHIECMAYGDGARNFYFNKGFGKTRTIAKYGKSPFGWIKLTFN